MAGLAVPLPKSDVRAGYGVAHGRNAVRRTGASRHGGRHERLGSRATHAFDQIGPASLCRRRHDPPPRSGAISAPSSASALLALAAVVAASLATWTVDDPSFSHATDHAARNMLGIPGAIVADLLMQFFGLAASLAPAAAGDLGVARWSSPSRAASAGAPLATWLAGTLAAALALATLPAAATLAAADRPRRRHRRPPACAFPPSALGAQPTGVARCRRSGAGLRAHLRRPRCCTPAASSSGASRRERRRATPPRRFRAVRPSKRRRSSRMTKPTRRVDRGR